MVTVHERREKGWQEEKGENEVGESWGSRVLLTAQGKVGGGWCYFVMKRMTAKKLMALMR